jgi:hypothetical protein
MTIGEVILMSIDEELSEKTRDTLIHVINAVMEAKDKQIASLEAANSKAHSDAAWAADYARDDRSWKDMSYQGSW